MSVFKGTHSHALACNIFWLYVCLSVCVCACVCECAFVWAVRLRGNISQRVGARILMFQAHKLIFFQIFLHASKLRILVFWRVDLFYVPQTTHLILRPLSGSHSLIWQLPIFLAKIFLLLSLKTKESRCMYKMTDMCDIRKMLRAATLPQIRVRENV